ncbi:YecA/YgfB family protein [Candidatus Pantoea multigeneris]|uniref:YecA family protein n=1 Tax=Candidatus Pantoea multigeneris TaxID=2608357 RepID=A0ABX0RGH5_9GAMM|nr:YecA family protein [Pantoea multigeneris]NIF22544.1 YecA family protein [Pantoea multigeneris]
MKDEPLNENELAWLEEILEKYSNDASVVDVSELDGLLTAVLSSPVVAEPSEWLVAVWGGEKNIPKWTNEREMNRFINLCFQHMSDIGERLEHYPDQFEPLFGVNEMEGREFTVVEDWCFGYMRGVDLANWPALPADLQTQLDAIALHGRDEQLEALESLTPEAFADSIEAIKPAALELYDYLSSLEVEEPEPQQPVVNENKVGRNDPCPCGSGKKFKQCCL